MGDLVWILHHSYQSLLLRLFKIIILNTHVNYLFCPSGSIIFVNLNCGPTRLAKLTNNKTEVQRLNLGHLTSKQGLVQGNIFHIFI